jgi:hypothetical protein
MTVGPAANAGHPDRTSVKSATTETITLRSDIQQRLVAYFELLADLTPGAIPD